MILQDSVLVSDHIVLTLTNRQGLRLALGLAIHGIRKRIRVRIAIILQFGGIVVENIADSQQIV